MELQYYPITDFGPVMKGMVIGALGIIHVFVAQFAIGGGMLMCYFQWLAQTGRCASARLFLKSYFQVLVLISFVVGALTGVGMWFVTIQISPRTIGLMVDQFHWIWAIEWTFFCVEVTVGYAFYRYAARLTDRVRFTLLATYTLAAWFSLFWVNGILSWQLTPGRWVVTGSVWAGFFNPSFWPSLLFRTITSMATAALAACVIINTMSGADRATQATLLHRASHFLVFMVLMPVLGVWYLAVVPEDSRSWVLGGSTTMTMFMGLAVSASLLIGLYAVIGLYYRRLYVNAATATLLCALALGATAGAEFVREGIRKPYTIRHALYSNSIGKDEVAYLRRVGSVTHDPYPLDDQASYPNDQVRLGARVLRFQCSVCHTMSGANGLTHLTGYWAVEQLRLNIARLQFTRTFMPPFAGNAHELEALVQLMAWTNAGRPDEWSVSDDRQAVERIERWLEEAGTSPGRPNLRAASPEEHD